MAQIASTEKDRPHESGAFAWIVVIALGLMSAGTTGTYSIVAGSFVAPVCEDLGFDYTSFSFYFTAILLGLALGLPLLSRFIPKVIGKPWHIGIELVLIAAGAAMAFYTEAWMFIASAAVIGICFSFTTGVCMSDVIDQWFSKSSGLAIGLAWGVNSLCTLLLSPVVTLVIEQQGWRVGFIVLAAVSAAMILPASAFIIRFKPSDRNMLPYGETVIETSEDNGPENQDDVLTGMTLRDAVKTPSFILCALLLCVAQLTCCMNQLFPTYASEVGFNPIVGSLMVSAASLSDIFLNPFVGKTCDKLGAIKATVAWTAVSISSFLLLIIGGNSETVSIIAAGVNDVMFAIVGTAMPMLLLSLFGSKDFGRIYSIVCSAGYIVGAFGMPVMMKVYGMAGSFQGVFIFCIVCNLMIAAFAIISGLLNKAAMK